MGFFFAFSFSCHENRRRAHGRTVERMRAVSRGGWQSVMRTVKGKVRVAGQDRSRDRDKDRMEGRGRRFLSLTLKHRFLTIFSRQRPRRTGSNLVGRQAAQHSTYKAFVVFLVFVVNYLAIFFFWKIVFNIGASMCFFFSFLFSCSALRRLLAVMALVMVRWVGAAAARC